MLGLCLFRFLPGADAVDLQEASYAKYFDRAQALIPGVTVVEQSLVDADAWEIKGGRLVGADGGMRVEADAASVDLIWKGRFPPADSQDVRLEWRITADAPAQVMCHVFTDERFNRVGGWQPADGKTNSVLVYTPPWRRYGDLDKQRFDGVKFSVHGTNLAGSAFTVKLARLKSDYSEGFFRCNLELPAGEIWSAAAEVGDAVTLYVNGRPVDDATIIMPRPTSKGSSYYLSRRVDLQKYFVQGRNVLGMHVRRTGNAPAAYLRGAVIMADGRRMPLDSNTDWVWHNAAPGGWADPGYDDSGWRRILDRHASAKDTKQSFGYRGQDAMASRITAFGFSYRPRGNLPCYDGLIRLCNPADNKLFFNEDKDFLLEIWIPPGFKGKQPELAWEIQRYHPDGTFEEAAQGKVVKFDLAESQTEGVSEAPVKSLVGKINSVRLPRGIYVLTSRLRVNGEVIEERDPEALVVTGRVRMEKVAGDTLEQGLDLALEQTIDFTDPADPHPWFETDHKGPIPAGRWGSNYYHTVEPALIVERNGLKYRTTRPVDWAQFSCQVEFGHPGDWYLLALEYPDDAERWIGVSCNADRPADHLRKAKPEERYSASSKCGPAIWTGGKYPNTGRMLEMKWLYRPDPGGHAINVMSLMKDTAAAAARLKVYHVQGRLSELDAGGRPEFAQRRFGMVTERTYPWVNGIYNLFSSFDSGQVILRGDQGAGQYTNNAIVDWCEHLRLLEDAASHYAEYMRFAGQNLHAMGCFQYGDDNTASQYITGDPRIHDSSENMLARVLAANGLMFYASVEFICTQRLGRKTPKPEWFFTDREGNNQVAMWAGKFRNLNFLHPEVESEMIEVARQLAECYKHQPNFLGINWTAYFDGFFIPSYRSTGAPAPALDPMERGYGDLTIGMFEKDTGIKIPVAGANREPSACEQRYQFLTSAEMKPVWLNWRARKMAEFFAKVNQAIGAVRSGLETVAGCYLNTAHISEWKARNILFPDYLDQWGWNPETFQELEGVWLMPWLPVAARYAPAARAHGYAFGWQGNHDPDFYRPFNILNKRAMMLHAGWIEVERIAANYPYRAGWPRPYQQTMMGQQREEMALEPYTQAMIGMDPQMVMMGFTDVSPYVGVEGMQRKFARVLRRLPWGRFEPVLNTGFDSNFAIRALRAGNDYLFYVANPGYWPVTGTVTLANAGEVIDLVSGKSAAVQDGAIRVALEPFGIAAFRASEISNLSRAQRDLKPQMPQITAWTADPLPASELAHMQNMLRLAEDAAAQPGMAEFLGAQDYGVLTGGMAAAEHALGESRYAAAWAALADAGFWTVVRQQAPEIKFLEFTRLREMPAPLLDDGLAPVIDGVLDDHVWNDEITKPAGRFVTIGKAYSELETDVRVAAAAGKLWLAFEMRDPEPAKVRGVTDRENVRGTIWGSGDDIAVFFIMPNASNYYQLAVTANGAVFAQQNYLRDGRRTGVNYDYAPDWKAVAARSDQGWNVEVEFELADAFGERIRNGDAWKFNFHRMFRLKQYPLESWSFNPGDLHSIGHFGTVRFEKPER